LSDEVEVDVTEQFPRSLVLRDRRYFYTHYGKEDQGIAVDWLNQNMSTRLFVSSRSTTIIDLVWAIQDNSGGKYAVVPLSLMFMCWFEHEDDAVAFKLGYDQHLVPIYVTQKHV
jgi:hypothetical protein